MRCRLPSSYFGNIWTDGMHLLQPPIRLIPGYWRQSCKGGDGKVGKVKNEGALHLGEKKSILIVRR